MVNINEVLASPVIATLLGAAFTLGSAILVQTFRIVRRISTLESDVRNVKQTQHSMKMSLRKLSADNDYHHHHINGHADVLSGETS